jgi:hypothetical protein
MNNSNSNLEPRLVEYLKRKKFYEENDITTNNICLEKQYQITKKDIEKINKLNKVNKESNNDRIYIQKPVKNYDENNDLIDFSKTKTKFEMTNMYDPRLERITEKVKKEKEASKYKYNTTNLQRNYDMYSRDFSSTTSNDFSNEFNLDNIRDELNAPLKNNYEANSNFNTHELISPSSQHQYHNPPVVQRDQRQPYQRTSQPDRGIGSGYSKSYRIPETPSFQKSNTFDIDNKITIPANNCRKNDLNTLYNEFNTFGNMKNIDYENYVKYGYPTSKARSLGFENASEHFYQFIDSDIQDPKHVVSDRPILTRLDNKATARSKQRDIY